MNEFNKGYNAALKEADVMRFFPYNLMYDAEGDVNQYDITPKQMEKCMLEHLTDRECQVIRYRYRDRLTLEETGKKLGVTRERIRQIEARAIRKLRYYMRGYQVVPMSEVANATERYNELQTKYENLQKLYEQKFEQAAPEIPSRIPIEKLDLSVRSYNCLKRHGIHYLDEVQKLSEEDLYNIRNMGKKSIQEIMFRVSQYGGGQ